MNLRERLGVDVGGVEIEEAVQWAAQHGVHPYTQALVAAIPLPDPRRRKPKMILQGDVPSPIDPPSGCRFHTRCPYVQEICKTHVPPLNNYSVSTPHFVACHFAGEVGPR